MELETWKPVVGFEDRYAVSSLGRVMRTLDGDNTYAGRLLSPRTDPEGRRVVKLGGRPVKVHRLVATAFYGPSPLLVRHLDGNPANNHLTNLRFGTPVENYADAVRHGTVLARYRTSPFCRNGHELTDENSYWKPMPSGNLCRLCRTCSRAAKRRYNERVKRASQA